MPTMPCVRSVDTVQLAYRGMESIVRTTGSMVSLLSFVQQLQSRCDEPIPEGSPLRATSEALVAQIRGFAEEERRSLSSLAARKTKGGLSLAHGELPGTAGATSTLPLTTRLGDAMRATV
jgi:hypothetical protein